MRTIPCSLLLLALSACETSPGPEPAPRPLALAPDLQAPPIKEASRAPGTAPAPAPRVTQQLMHGITPATPENIELAEHPGPVPLSPEPDPLRVEGTAFSRAAGTSILFTVLGAPPDATALLGADFTIIACPHAPVTPELVTTPQGIVRIAYPEAEWAAFRTARAARAGLDVMLAFEGPSGDLERIGRLIPDIVGPAEGVPFSPLHPFGARLYAEYIKTYLAASRDAHVVLVQPAGPLSPFLNDLETWKSFRRDVESKYARITDANAAWGTDYEGFWEVLPPASARRERAGAREPLATAADGSRDPLHGDWIEYLWDNRRELAQALGGLAHGLTSAPGPLVALRSADPLAARPIATGADAYVFDVPLAFLPEPSPLSSHVPTYLAELARSADKPIVDVGGYTAPPDTPTWQQVALLRHFIWRRCWHGASALALPSAAGRVLAAAPRFMAEMRAVAPLLAAPGDDPSPVVLLHPAETLRALGDEQRAVALAHVVAWWQALAAHGTNVTVISSEQLQRQHLQRVRAVLCPLAFVLGDTAFALLEQFAQEGGIVVTEWGAFARRDNAGRGRNTRRFLGFQVVMPASLPPSVALAGGEEIELTPRPIDGARGASVELLLAEAYGPRAGRVPVSAVNRYGQGYVYSMLVSLSERPRAAWLVRIAHEHGISPEIRVTVEGGRAADLIETGVRSVGDARLAVLFNLGPPRQFLLSFTTPRDGAFSLRDTLTGALLQTASGTTSWDANALRGGVAVFLDRGDTAAMLLARANGRVPLEFPGIALKRREMLARLDVETAVGPRVRIPDEPGSPFPYPTARAVLAHTGFRCSPLRTPDDLRGSTVAWIDCRSPDIGSKEILQFVTRGGGLLLEAGALPGEEPSMLVKDLLAGLKCTLGPRVKANVNAPPGRSIPLVPLGIARHDATAGVETLVLPCASTLETYPENAQILVHGTQEATPVGAPLFAALTYGAGRVVVTGAGGWAAPLALELGDNAKFLAASVRYLAGLPAPLLGEADIAECLFVTRAQLAQARAEEADPARTTFLPYPVAGLADPFPRPEDAQGPYWATFSPARRLPTPPAGTPAEPR